MAGWGELRERLGALLQRERLAPAGEISWFDTPRRLAVMATGIPAAQPDVTEQVTGPSAQVAFKDGQPTPAAHAFAKKVGVDVGALERVTTPKGEYLGATVARKGRAAAEILAEALPKEIASLYWPKNMYWRKRGEVFVRPVRWLVAMLDYAVVPMEVFGIAAGNHDRHADRSSSCTLHGGDLWVPPRVLTTTILPPFPTSPARKPVAGVVCGVVCSIA